MDSATADYVIECSTEVRTTSLHVKGGIKKVFIASPEKEANMFPIGVNERWYTTNLLNESITEVFNGNLLKLNGQVLEQPKVQHFAVPVLYVDKGGVSRKYVDEGVVSCEALQTDLLLKKLLRNESGKTSWRSYDEFMRKPSNEVSENVERLVINVYFTLPRERESEGDGKFPKYYFADSCVYTMAFSAIHVHNNHWLLAVINPVEGKLQIVDSIYNAKDLEYEGILITLAVASKNNKEVKIHRWSHEHVVAPQQANTYDCGIFVLKYADCYSRDLPLCFTQENIPDFRIRTAHDFINGKAS